MNLAKSVAMSFTLAIALHGGAQATTYDPAADFSSSINPTTGGVWSYGYATTLTGFNLYTASAPVNSLQYWALDIGGTYTPNVAFNPTDSTISFASTEWRANQISLHPGPNNEFSFIRFTAPTAGAYALTSAFNMRSFGGTHSTDVYVLLNGVIKFSEFTFNFNDEKSYSNPLLVLAAGDKLDFVVGSNTSYFGDTTELRASLIAAAVPEPETYALMLAGLGAIGYAARRRKGFAQA